MSLLPSFALREYIAPIYPGRMTGTWTPPLSVTPAAHSPRKEWVQLQPVSAPRELLLIEDCAAHCFLQGQAAPGLWAQAVPPPWLDRARPAHQASSWRPFGGTAQGPSAGPAGYRATPVGGTSRVTRASLKPRVAPRFAGRVMDLALRGSCGPGQHREAPGSARFALCVLPWELGNPHPYFPCLFQPCELANY